MSIEGKFYENPELNSPDSMEKIFRDFVYKNGYTFEQVRDAYYRLCGLHHNCATPEAENIFTEMNKLSKYGFPMGRFVEIIDELEELNQIIEKFHQFVGNLDINEKGKKMLQSIVNKQRAGEINCLVDEKMFASFEIAKKTDLSKEVLARELLNILNEIIEKVPRGKKLEFIFMEN